MRPFLTTLMVAFLLVASLLASAANGQTRTIPPAAQTGKLTAIDHRTVRIEPAEPRLTRIFIPNDYVDRLLAPGARIFNAANRSIASNSLPPESIASYLLNAQGQIRTVWVLTPAEFAQYQARPKP